MHYKYRNVNSAFHGLVKAIHTGEILTNVLPSRAGEVARIEEPVIISYTNPWERVLFNQARDCNPFFHLYEAIWMMAGENRVAPLTFFNKRMTEFSDDGTTLWGAYGFRWRQFFHYDQLRVIVDELIKNPHSRRCVLTMWDPMNDLTKAVNGGKDVPCNTHAYFEVEDGEYLNMTVCNRSNDLVWGALGANVVHFSFLQETMASLIGVQCGDYHQFTNNLHVYTERWEPEKYLDEDHIDPYLEQPVEAMPLITEAEDPQDFLADCLEFTMVDCHKALYRTTFFTNVAVPMVLAFKRHKNRDYKGALDALEDVWAQDWREAGQNWIYKRQRMWEKKNA